MIVDCSWSLFKTESESGLDKRSYDQLIYKSKSLVGHYGFTKEDIEDIQQELQLHLYQQMPKYDPNRSSKATFVDRILENAIRDLIRRQKSQCRDFAMCTVSLDQSAFSNEESTITIMETIENTQHSFGASTNTKNNMDKVDLRMDVQRVLAGIEPKFQQFCLDLMSMKSATDIAKEHNICRQTFYVWKDRMRAIFESAGLRVYACDNVCTW